jgi:hypothetical protein
MAESWKVRRSNRESSHDAMISHADMTGLLKSRGNVNFTEATTPSFLRVGHQSTTDQTKQPEAAPRLRRSPRSWRHETPEFARQIRHTRPKRPTMSGAFLLHEGLQCWNPQIIKESHGPGLRPSTTPIPLSDGASVGPIRLVIVQGCRESLVPWRTEDEQPTRKTRHGRE